MTNIKKATKYRAEQGYKGGVVIIGIDGEIGGWMNELRDPQHWMPGCIAVDAEGNQWEARGGDYYNGAVIWEPYRQAA